MPFANPIIGGGGSLVYPSIHSPNFSIPLKMGWSIDKNGNAYFFGIVTSGTFEGGQFILNVNGLFIYTGTPANGNLTISIAAAGGTDTFGNNYGPGITCINPSTLVNTILNAGTLTIGLGVNNIMTANSNGFFLYSPNAGAGNLIVALAKAAGTDAFGNAFKEGLSINNPSGTDYLQMLGANPPTLFIGTGNAAESQPGELLNQVSAAGSSVVLSTTLRAPRVTGENANAFCSVVLISPSADLTTDPSPDASIVVSDGTTTSAYNQTATQFAFSNVPVNFAQIATPNTPGGGVYAYANSTTTSHLKYKTTGGNNYATGRVSNNGPSNQSVSSTTPVDVTNMSMNLDVGTHTFRARVQLKANANAGQWSLLLAFSGTATISYGFQYISAAGVTALTANQTAFGTLLSGPATSVLGFYFAEIEGTIDITVAGTFKIQAETSAVADTFNIFRGSTLQAVPIV